MMDYWRFKLEKISACNAESDRKIRNTLKYTAIWLLYWLYSANSGFLSNYKNNADLEKLITIFFFNEPSIFLISFLNGRSRRFNLKNEAQENARASISFNREWKEMKRKKNFIYLVRLENKLLRYNKISDICFDQQQQLQRQWLRERWVTTCFCKKQGVNHKTKSYIVIVIAAHVQCVAFKWVNGVPI